MNVFNRLVMLVVAVGIIVGGVVTMGGAGEWLPAAGFEPIRPLVDYVSGLAELDGDRSLWAMVGGLLTSLAGFLLLFLELRAPRYAHDLLLRKDKLGAVTVSMSGLRRLTEHVVSGISGVEDVSAEARRTREGVSLRCRVVVKPEASAPQLAEEVRQQLGSAVRHHIGQPASQIDVHAQVGALANSRKRVR
jgi:hypothetical protein